MCGLFGYSVKEDIGQDKRSLLAAVLSVKMDLRGGDSWGLSRSGELIRGMGLIAEGITARSLSKTRTLAVHTRKATTGTVTLDNAHPFAMGDVVGAHNGIIINHNALNVKYNRTCNVDSQHILLHLDEGKPLNDIEGWGTVWYYKKATPKRMYLFRSDSGDLSIFGIGSVSNCRGVIWASTETAILAAAHLTGLTVFEYESKANTLYYMENGKMFYVEGEKPTITETLLLGIDNYSKYFDFGKKRKRKKKGKDKYAAYESTIQSTTYFDNDSTLGLEEVMGLNEDDVAPDYCDGCQESYAPVDLVACQEWLLCTKCRGWSGYDGSGEFMGGGI